ncbi:unnamed protein product [Amoebophrya sp. A120]|nr:unnamed protein product [Amoebophrya sp. A120]|eukprot:GSA120T00000360001.1
MPQPPPSSVSSSAHGTQQEDNASPGSSSTSPPSSIGGAATAAALGASSGSSSSLSGFILAVALFFGFLSFVWWLAWQLSLSKVPILREIFSDKEPKQHKNSSKQRTSRTAGNVGSFGADIAMGAGPGGATRNRRQNARASS